MSGTLFIMVAGCVIFATVTVASLWVGYALLQQAWIDQNPELRLTDSGTHPPSAKHR